MTNTFGKVVAIALLFGGAACNAPSASSDIAMNGYRQFEDTVYPVLLRDCAFHACHGGPERFFRVWGPGRARLNPLTREFAQQTGDEAPTNYSVALSMIDTKHPSRSLLLRKPLAVEAGGAGHLGVDRYGRNVYRTVNDSGYVTIKNWVMAIAANTMAPPGTSPMVTPPAQ